MTITAPPSVPVDIPSSDELGEEGNRIVSGKVKQHFEDCARTNDLRPAGCLMDFATGGRYRSVRWTMVTGRMVLKLVRSRTDFQARDDVDFTGDFVTRQGAKERRDVRVDFTVRIANDDERLTVRIDKP
ncbi:hypothetical protein [Mariniluteicoccus flavus]